MHNIDLIQTLTTGLGVALTFGWLAVKMRLPAIVGYLVAGLLIGPYTPGFAANRAIAEQLAEIGVILLMFGVGLHFHLKDLLAVRKIAVTGALTEITLVASLGISAARAFGYPWPAAVIFGLSLSVASTVVLTRVLADTNDLQSPTGRIAIGWLVVEDIFTVFALVVLAAVFGRGESTHLPFAIGIAGLKLAALMALTLLGGARLIPRLLTAAARTQSRELFTLTVLVIALGIAVGSAVFFQVSMALGAFLAGMVVGQSEFSHRAASEALPMRDAFAVLFFVSSGMLFDPAHLLRAPLEILATVSIVLLAKPASALLIVAIMGRGANVGVRLAISLAQIGEFSFILASLGRQLDILPESAMHSIVAASIVSITMNPLLYRLAPALERGLLGFPPTRWLFTPAAVSRAAPLHNDPDKRRAIIVGYGPVGETVCRLLRDHGFDPVIIELNIETVRRLKAEGIEAVYGDAMREDVLKEAGVEHAFGLILSSPASEESAELIRAAREMNPSIRVLARSRFLSLAGDIRKAGADEVFSGEAEVAMAMIEYILDDLGATPEQMDREREAVRAGLYGARAARLR